MASRLSDDPRLASRARSEPPPRMRISEATVAVIGAATFLGRNLIGLLQEDPQVRRVIAIDVEAPSTAGHQTRVYDVDLTEPLAEERLAEILAAENVDTVVHLGFLATPTNAAAWAHELESAGTLHVLNACRRTGTHKLVMWSQTWLYGAHPTNPNFLTEAHPLRARRGEPYFEDKLAAEKEVMEFGRPGSGRAVTILRTAPILGPTVRNHLTRYLSRRRVPTILGFDPLWQFIHEADAVAALKHAVDHDVAGVFNIVGDGVLPLSTVIKLAGRAALPLPRSLARATLGALWLAQAAEAPPSFLDYLQYLCVADGDRCRQILGFVPAHTTREALIDYTNAQHLRDVKLLSETTP